MPHKHHHGHGNHNSNQKPTPTTELTVRSDFGHKKHDGIGSMLAKVAHGLVDHANHHHAHHHQHRAPEPRPAPMPINPPTPKPDYNQRFAQHKRNGDRLFRIGGYDFAITEYDLAIKCHAQTRQIPLGAVLLYAVTGLDRLLSDPEIESLYIRIAECYMLQHKYDLALQYLKPIRSRPAANAMIAACNQHKRDGAQTSAVGNEHPRSQARVIELPPQPKIKQPAWETQRHAFVAEAQRLLGFDISIASKQITNYKTFEGQVQRCIALFDTHKHEPQPAESELRNVLVDLQRRVNLIKAEIDAAEEQRLAQEKEQRAIERARINEPKIITELHQAQTQLAANEFCNALQSLQSASKLATGTHAAYFINPRFQDLSIFTQAVTALQSIVKDFNLIKNEKAQSLAEAVVARALPSDKRLFYVHKDRIINAMRNKFSTLMHKFYGKSIDQLQNEEFFKHMSALIEKDCVKIDSNKKFWRGGLGDSKHLVHSHEMGPVLESIIEQAPLYPFDTRLEVFALTDTQIVIPSAPRMAPSINWYDTLCNWPNVVHHTTNLESGIAFAAVVAEEATHNESEKSKLAYVA